MWPFMYSDNEEDEKDAYEDLAAAEDKLELFRHVVQKKLELKEKAQDQYP